MNWMHHGVTVDGIGREAVEKIYYQVLTQNYLNSVRHGRIRKIDIS